MELSEETTRPAVKGKLLTQASGPDEQLLLDGCGHVQKRMVLGQPKVLASYTTTHTHRPSQVHHGWHPLCPYKCQQLKRQRDKGISMDFLIQFQNCRVKSMQGNKCAHHHPWHSSKAPCPQQRPCFPLGPQMPTNTRSDRSASKSALALFMSMAYMVA